MIQVRLNGDQYVVPATIQTLADLISHLSLNAAHIVIQHNDHIVGSSSFATQSLQANDAIDIVHFVGGGSPINSN